MIKIIDRTNLHGSREELREAHRFRHKIFVEEAGWEPLRKPDGLERDAFDDEYAIHMLLYDQRQLVGYQRLLPTVRPYLLTEIYPQLCDGPPPASERTYELTRFAVDRVYRGAEMSISWAVAKLVLGYVEWGLENGIDSVVIELAPLHLIRLLQGHLMFRSLGHVQKVGGQDTIAVVAHFDERTRSRLTQLVDDGRRSCQHH